MIRHWAYDIGILHSVKFNKPVLVVGNLSTGGTGKTPLTIYLAQLLRNYSPALLSRGYGRNTKGFKWVQIDDQVSDSGDEPLLFKKALRYTLVAVCEDRVEGINQILKENDPGVILLDDAFQHRRLNPGFSILLFDYDSIVKPHFLLPAGDERDLWMRRKKANVVVITKCPDVFDMKVKRHISETLFNGISVYFSRLKYGKIKRFSGEELSLEEINKCSLYLVTGIAKPAKLKKDLSEIATIIHHQKFPDHYNFKRLDLDLMQKNILMFAPISPLFITTSKDRGRIEPLLEEDEKRKWLEIPVETEFENKEQFNALILDYVRTNS